MRKIVPLVLIPAIALGGCTLFRGKTAAPDEFQVARSAPLVIPPDYTLTPPVAGGPVIVVAAEIVHQPPHVAHAGGRGVAHGVGELVGDPEWNEVG